MDSEPKPKTPGDFTVEQAEALRPLAKLVGLFSPKLRKQFREVESHMDGIKIMLANRDHFARIYSPLGWANYDRMSTDVVAKALEQSIEDGEATLTAFHLDPDTLTFFGYRFHTSAYEPWAPLYERAVERAAAADYLSAVPLVLAIIDGISTTTSGKHPFSGGADAPVFDTQTSGPGGLSEGFALLGSTRRKLDADPITAPYRHGIVHGLNPNYGHPIVAAKAFNLLQATVDYFDRRKDEAQRLSKAAEEQKPVDLRELGRSLVRNAETRKQLDQWKARPPVHGVVADSDVADGLAEGTPEAVAAEYLSLLVARNFGALARLTVDYPKRSIAYRAGRIREDMKDVNVAAWTITGVEDTAAAMTNVTVELSGKMNGRAWSGEQVLRLMYADEDNDALIRGAAGGAWIAMPNFIPALWLSALRAERT